MEKISRHIKVHNDRESSLFRIKYNKKHAQQKLSFCNNDGIFCLLESRVSYLKVEGREKKRDIYLAGCCFLPLVLLLLLLDVVVEEDAERAALLLLVTREDAAFAAAAVVVVINEELK